MEKGIYDIDKYRIFNKEKYRICNLCLFSDNKKYGLSCGHNICINCFYKLCLFNKKIIYSAKQENIIKLECITCGNGFLSVSKAIILNYLNENINHEIKLNCLDHDLLEAKFYCKKCDWRMCERCKASHSSFSALSKHDLIQNKKKILAFSKNNKFFCEDHFNSLLNYYCTNCKKLTCDICKNIKHEKHKLEYIEDYNKKIFIDFQNESNSLKQNDGKTFESFLNNELVNFKSNLKLVSTKILDEMETTIKILNNTSEKFKNLISSYESEVELNFNIFKKLDEKFYRDSEEVIMEDSMEINFLVSLTKFLKFQKPNLKIDVSQIENILKNLNSNLKTLDVLNDYIFSYKLNNINNFEVVKEYDMTINYIISLEKSIITCSNKNEILIWSDFIKCIYKKFESSSSTILKYGNINNLFKIDNLNFCLSTDSIVEIWCIKDLSKPNYIINCKNNGVYYFSADKIILKEYNDLACPKIWEFSKMITTIDLKLDDRNLNSRNKSINYLISSMDSDLIIGYNSKISKYAIDLSNNNSLPILKNQIDIGSDIKNFKKCEYSENLIVILGYNNGFKLINSNLECIFHEKDINVSFICDLKFEPLVYGTEDGSVIFNSRIDPESKIILKMHSRSINIVKFTMNRNMIITSSNDGKLKIWK